MDRAAGRNFRHRRMSACFSNTTKLYPSDASRQADRGRVMAVFGYVRVSTMRQAEDGESLDVQERTIAGYAMMHGLKLTETFVEGGVSGSVPLAERAQGKAMLTALKAGDVVITAK